MRMKRKEVRYLKGLSKIYFKEQFFLRLIMTERSRPTKLALPTKLTFKQKLEVSENLFRITMNAKLIGFCTCVV